MTHPVCAVCGRRIESYIDGRMNHPNPSAHGWWHLPTVAGLEAEADHPASLKEES